jgi:ethanolamine utilization protein EutP (predicted NTPase)
LLVADGTRAHSLDAALELKREIDTALGPLPFVLVLNKDDLASQWEIAPERILALQRSGTTVFRTSAKNGEGVEAMFQHFATQALLERA